MKKSWNGTSLELDAYLAHRREEVDGALDRLLPPETAWPETLHRAMRYSLFAGGKRLRPILALEAAQAVGGESRPVLEAACALELIHTYSLIHDDLPALDDDAMRRGAPTCHVAFGEATAILAGDALLTHGLGLLAQFPQEEIYAAVKVQALQVLVAAIGTEGMIGGQIADLEAARNGGAPSVDLVRRIHENKTGRLIRAALAVGGILSFAEDGDLETLDEYGRAVGLAFQIKDDLLDVESDAETLGKATGKDAAAGKATFPAALGAERSRAMLQETVAAAVEAAARLPRGAAGWRSWRDSWRSGGRRVALSFQLSAFSFFSHALCHEKYFIIQECRRLPPAGAPMPRNRAASGPLARGERALPTRGRGRLRNRRPPGAATPS